MLGLGSNLEIFACTSPVDFRKQHDGLVAIVRRELKKDPLDGSLYVFFNRRRDRAKLLFWDKNGFWMFYKRLERGTFEGLRRTSGAGLTLSRADLSMLLDGIELGKGQKRRHFADVVRIDGRAREQQAEDGRGAAERHRSAQVDGARTGYCDRRTGRTYRREGPHDRNPSTPPLR